MKICIPTLSDGGMDETICDHIGQAPTFTVVDLESNEVETIRNTSDHMGGSGKPPEQIARTGSKVVICSGLGPRALQMLRESGIEIYVGASGTVRNALQMYHDGKLRKASDSDACRHHRHSCQH